MKEEVLKIFQSYAEQSITEEIANQIEENIKTFFKIIIGWKEDTG